MSNSESNKLAIVKNLIYEWKYVEALQQVNDIEQKENLTTEENFSLQYYKGRLHYRLGQFEITRKIAEKLYQESKKMEMPLFTMDALTLMFSIFVELSKPGEGLKCLVELENIFKSIMRRDSVVVQEREYRLLIRKGFGFFYEGKLDLALDYYHKSLSLAEKINPEPNSVKTLLSLIASVHTIKGELALALEFLEKSLLLIPMGESDHLMIERAHIYDRLGQIYYQKGDLDEALEYHKRALKINKKIREHWCHHQYFSVIRIFIAKKNLNQARNYLQKLKEFNEKYDDNLDGYIGYELTNALVLNISPRLHKRVEASNLLKKFVKKYKNYFWGAHLDIALTKLCEWYFEEFRLTNQMEILDDIQPLIDQLQKLALRRDSYSSLANVKLLQAKLALLQINITDARRLLTEAQQIAEEHDLQLLAGEISKEHDHLLEELKLWESIKKTQASVSERLKLASLDVVLDRMQGKRAIEPLESTGQQPVALFIIAEGGVLLFSYPFSDEWKREDDLFGSFLSAFSTFSDEFFSQGLDRAKFGDDTLLLQSVGTFSICYLFRGQTYFAKQKLEKFVETMQENLVIWEILEKFEKASQVAELKDLPNIESFLTNIFLN